MVIQALTLGLSTGLYCATACFPMLVASLFSRQDHRSRNIALGVGQFMLGRLVAYLIVGLIAGITGSLLGEYSKISNALVSTVYVVSGGLMLLYGIVESFPHAKACAAMSVRFQSSSYLLVLGFLTGMNICPPFVLAFSAAADLGGVAKSVFFFFLFFLATSVYMLPFFFSGFAAKKLYVKKAARIISMLMGGYFLFLGGERLFQILATALE
ncbi:MAG TPA: sulfite exporter TauE/SafE family protein [Fibrobacteraceae bacterium]|nr:sulfite exporter TauE/SafE family protein [Fibrobacteraceae bacterium]